MADIPSMQELMLALEMENRAIAANRASLLRSSNETFRSSTAASSELERQTPSAPSVAAFGMRDISPLNSIAGNLNSAPSPMQPRSRLLALVGLSAGTAANSGSVAVLPNTGGTVFTAQALSATNSSDLSTIVEGLIKQRQLMNVKRPPATRDYPLVALQGNAPPHPQMRGVTTGSLIGPSMLSTVGQAVQANHAQTGFSLSL